ncbi:MULTISPECIES: hypothetical protein [unclassified Acidovorax]|jgi:hypothetical protein|uniref:hypothetical protein n=1 Tax=unclassified Acidovorax TaxID=2684926 RepID=UPI0025BAF6B3|nr:MULTISPECIES: hypothetical protein [unclassified Acidovorax]HQT48888.1 hypothetical protein [Acidovorax defluvii]
MKKRKGFTASSYIHNGKKKGKLSLFSPYAQKQGFTLKKDGCADTFTFLRHLP